jgi:hypothetical protein
LLVVRWSLAVLSRKRRPECRQQRRRQQPLLHTQVLLFPADAGLYIRPN